MLVSLTVGKVDAGVAVLLTEDKRLIEFPSILLPSGISSGSIVDINVSRNYRAENDSFQAFTRLQTEIYQTFGVHSPLPPVLRCRNATQTSVVLEWDAISLATAELRSLSLYRNNSKAGAIPRPLEMTSTKISGLAVDTEYTFFLVLRTSAGTYTSEKLVVRTHKMTELSGITITPGIMPAQLRESLQATVERIGAKMIDGVRIDTTHFVCTEGRGQAWEKAMETNIPVVVPDWVKGCEREGRIVGVRQYYLNADPRQRTVGQGVPGAGGQGQQQQQQQQQQRQQQQRQQQQRQPMQSPRTEVTPPTPERAIPERPVSGISGETAVESNGDTPPAPPPKFDPLPQDAGEQKAKAPAEEPKARKEDVKPPEPVPKDDEDEEEESDDDTTVGDPEKPPVSPGPEAEEKGSASLGEPAPHAEGRKSPSPSQEKFDEVEL